MERLLTIVIAAYNKEDLLPRCLDTLIQHESVRDAVQVLVINDGSKDRTLEIAQNYEKRFPGFIYAIDKPNGNYGSVMNKGLELAEGKYFRTLDADDRYDPDGFAHFVKTLKETDADLIVNAWTTYNEIDKTYQESQFDHSVTVDQDITITPDIWTPNLLEVFNVPGIVYKTAILRQSGLKWLEGICYTDTMYDFWPLSHIKTIRLVTKPTYVYTFGLADQSVSIDVVKKNFTHFYKVGLALLEEAGKHLEPNCVCRPCQLKLLYQIAESIYLHLTFDDKHKEEILAYHQQMNQLPDIKKQLVENVQWHGCHYLSGLDQGKLSLRFRLLRKLVPFLHRVTGK